MTKRILICLCLAGFAMFAIGNYALVLDFLHAIVNLFAAGRSYSKIFLFAAYSATLFVYVKFGPFVKLLSFRYYRYVLFSILAAAYAVNSISFFEFLRKYGFKFSDQITVFQGHELSTTRLLHNHVLKGALGAMLHMLHSRPFENLDPGLAFVGLVPAWLFLTGGILAFVFFIFTFQYFYKRYHSAVIKKKVLFAILYCVVSFSLLKNIFDGGLLNTETIVALACYVVLVFDFSTSAWKAAGGIIVAYLALLVLGLRLGFVENAAALHRLLYEALSSCFIYAVGAYIIMSGNFRRQEKLLLVLGILLLSVRLWDDLSIIQYRQQLIDQRYGAMVASYEDIRDPGFSEVYGIGPLRFFSYHPEHDVTVGQLLLRYNLLENFYPISVPWKTCLPHGQLSRFNFMLVTEVPLAQNSLGDGENIQLFFKPAERHGQWYWYAATVQVQSCLPRPLNALEELVRGQGQDTFFILNLVSNDFPDLVN